MNKKSQLILILGVTIITLSACKKQQKKGERTPSSVTTSKSTEAQVDENQGGTQKPPVTLASANQENKETVKKREMENKKLFPPFLYWAKHRTAAAFETFLDSYLNKGYVPLRPEKGKPIPNGDFYLLGSKSDGKNITIGDTLLIPMGEFKSLQETYGFWIISKMGIRFHQTDIESGTQLRDIKGFSVHLEGLKYKNHPSFKINGNQLSAFISQKINKDGHEKEVKKLLGTYDIVYDSNNSNGFLIHKEKKEIKLPFTAIDLLSSKTITKFSLLMIELHRLDFYGIGKEMDLGAYVFLMSFEGKKIPEKERESVLSDYRDYFMNYVDDLSTLEFERILLDKELKWFEQIIIEERPGYKGNIGLDHKFVFKEREILDSLIRYLTHDQ